MCVDTGHVENVVTRRVHLGFVIFIGRLPIIWHLRHQNTVELEAFGSELMVLKDGTETNTDLC